MSLKPEKYPPNMQQSPQATLASQKVNYRVKNTLINNESVNTDVKKFSTATCTTCTTGMMDT